MNSAKVININRSGSGVPCAVEQAREILRAESPASVQRRVVVALVAVVSAALLDIGLLYRVQIEHFTLADGTVKAATLEMWAASCMSLAWFFLIGYLWKQSATAWRMLAGCAYGLLLLLIAALLKDSYGSLFSNLWAGESNPLLPSAPGGDGPAWFVVFAGLLGVSTIFTVGGLLLLLMKDHLAVCAGRWRLVQECQRHIAQDEEISRLSVELEALTSLHAHVTNPVNAKTIIKRALTVARDRVLSDSQRQQEAMRRAAQDVRITQEQREDTTAKLSRLDSCMTTLRTLVLSLLAAVVFTAHPAQASPTAVLFDNPKTFQLLVDVSPSPGVNPLFLQNVWSSVEQLLRRMPVGSSVIVQSVGNAALTPLVFRSRIQVRHTREGDTMESMVRGVKAVLFSFPERFKTNQHQQSELIGAFFDASRNISPNTPGNVIVAITDLAENSPLASCANVQKAKPCTLPAPQFSLENTAVYVFGVGQGMPSDKAIHLTQQWAALFKKSGAKVAELHRD